MRPSQVAGITALASAASLVALALLIPSAKPSIVPATPDSAAALAVKIEAPASIAAGELAILTVTGEAPLLAWQAVPASPNFLPIDGGRRAVFTSPQAGSWTFVLAAGDPTELVQTSHVLTVTGPAPPPGPGPAPPPVSLTALVRGWKGRVSSAALAAEAERLAVSFESVAAQIAAGAIKTPEAIIQATASANQVALGAGRDPWRPFFESLRSELNRREAAGALDYPTLWREIAGGLRS